MAQIKVWNGAAWVQPNVKHWSGAAWIDHQTRYYTGTAWDTLESPNPPIVSARADGATNTLLMATCYAGCAFYNTGTEYEYNGIGSLTSATQWLDSGASAAVWVTWNRTGGSLSSWNSIQDSADGVRRNLASNSRYRILRSSVGISTISGYFTFHDAASGGNLLQTTSTVTWSAEYEFDPCPSCCFTHDTPVTLAIGIEMPIGKIKEGDVILTVRDNELAEEPVTGVITKTNRPMYLIEFEDGRRLRASADHPLHVKGKGASSIDFCDFEYKDLPIRAKLERGDLVSTSDGTYNAIKNITPMQYSDTVFTLENSPFFANGMLVY